MLIRPTALVLKQILFWNRTGQKNSIMKEVYDFSCIVVYM